MGGLLIIYFGTALCKRWRFEASFPRAENFAWKSFVSRVERNRSLKAAGKFPPPTQSDVWEPGVNPGRLRHCNGYKLPRPPTKVGKAGVRFEAEVRIPV
jgi:hypothetical protein